MQLTDIRLEALASQIQSLKSEIRALEEKSILPASN
jgi:hypothetical protein